MHWTDLDARRFPLFRRTTTRFPRWTVTPGPRRVKAPYFTVVYGRAAFTVRRSAHAARPVLQSLFSSSLDSPIHALPQSSLRSFIEKRWAALPSSPLLAVAGRRRGSR